MVCNVCNLLQNYSQLNTNLYLRIVPHYSLNYKSGFDSVALDSPTMLYIRNLY